VTDSGFVRDVMLSSVEHLQLGEKVVVLIRELSSANKPW
jgi:hypothetical protein